MALEAGLEDRHLTIGFSFIQKKKAANENGYDFCQTFSERLGLSLSCCKRSSRYSYLFPRRFKTLISKEAGT